MNFARRLSKLEKRRAISGQPRIVVRFEGPGSESLPQPKEPIDENAKVIVLRFVPTGAAEGDPGVETTGSNP
jgi:hypothetical protein